MSERLAPLLLRLYPRELALLLAAASLGACGADEPDPEDAPAADAAAPGGELGALPAAPPELEALAAEFADVCAGGGYRGNLSRTEFDPKKPGPHRLLFLTESGKAHPLNNVTPAAWRPRTAAEVELVACVGAVKKESIGICDYLNAATIVRSTQDLTIFVVAVRSGDVAGFDIPGNYPVSCPTTRTTRRELVGTPASPSLIKAVVLDHLVPVPDCAGTSLHPACYQCWSDVMPADCKSLPSTAYKIEELTAQVGETVTLHWPWSNPYGDLFRSAYQIDWSTSQNADLLSRLDGTDVQVKDCKPGSYTFSAQQKSMGPAGEVIVEQRKYYLSCGEETAP